MVQVSRVGIRTTGYLAGRSALSSLIANPGNSIRKRNERERKREREGSRSGAGRLRKQFSSITTVSSRNLRRRRLIKPLSCADIKSEVITVARVGYLIPRPPPPPLPILLIRLCFQPARFKRAAPPLYTKLACISRGYIHIYGTK